MYILGTSKQFPLSRFAGFDAVTLANNHFNDFGSKGANFTVEVLKKTGIKYFGVSYGKYADTQQVFLLSLRSIRFILFYKGTPGKERGKGFAG